MLYEVDSQYLGTSFEEEKSNLSSIPFEASTLRRADSPPPSNNFTQDVETRKPGFAQRSFGILVDFLFPDSQE